MLGDARLTLERAIEICKSREATEEQMKVLDGRATQESQISLVKKQKSKSQETFDCRRCGTNHGKRQCPAYGKQCEACGQVGHFKKVCYQERRSYKGNKQVNLVDTEDLQEKLFVGMVEAKSAEKHDDFEVFALGESEQSMWVELIETQGQLRRDATPKMIFF